MISTYNIKPKFQQLLRPLLNRLHNMGISANAITWMAILLSCGTGIWLWFYPSGFSFVLLPLTLLLRMTLNALDGMMARTFNMQSKKGEILNELGDVVSDFVLFFPLLNLFHLNLYVLLGFLFLSLVNEYAGILGKVVSGTRRYDGPMGKSDRALTIGLISLIFCFTQQLAPSLNYVFLVINLLLIVSTSIRIHKSLKDQ